MIESIDTCVRELQKKGCAVIGTTIIVPIDHGCGNRSFGRMDNLGKQHFQIRHLRITEKTLSDTVRKATKQMLNSDLTLRMIEERAHN